MVTAQVGNEIEHTGDVIIRHLPLKSVEGGGDFLLFLCLSGKESVVDVGHGLPLYAALQIVHAQIVHSRFMPKDGILRFGIHYHSVEIEQDGRCFCCIHIKKQI